MISNAIPGIANINTLVNNAPAKGIAVSSDVRDSFRKALTQANSENKAVSVTASLNKTLNQTVALSDNQPKAELADKATDKLDATTKAVEATKNGNDKSYEIKEKTDISERGTVNSTAEGGNVAEEAQETGNEFSACAQLPSFPRQKTTSSFLFLL